MDKHSFWFSTDYQCIKPFGKKLDARERNQIIYRLERMNMGCTDEKGALTDAIDAMMKENAEQKHICVFSDGVGVGKELRPLLIKARKENIHVSGVGYGGFSGGIMSTYREEAEALIVKDMDDLVVSLAEVIKKAFLKTTYFLRPPADYIKGASIEIIHRNEVGRKSVTLSVGQKFDYLHELVGQTEESKNRVSNFDSEKCDSLIEMAI